MKNAPVKPEIHPDILRISRIPSVANILEVVCDITGMGFAAIASVSESRWVACATRDKIDFGLSAGDELPIETTICSEILQHQRVVVIDDVSSDQEYRDHHTPKLYGLQSYISVPIIRKDGAFFGTICAIDRVANKINNTKVIHTFTLFSELIAFHLDTQDQVEESERNLRIERHNAEIREQFIAMLGHDLRNPVNAISNAAQLLLRSELDDRNRRLGSIISDATIRTKGLIDNILDFASGKLGEGIKLNYENSLCFTETIDQVITELQITWPDTKIVKNGQFSNEPFADYKRVAQLLSNVLGNAITHGATGFPIHIDFHEDPKEFQVTITNSGPAIPEHILPHLFKPFSRGKVKKGQEGLGLGLFIAKEIALAHGGGITVSSNSDSTSFTIAFPKQQSST